MGFITRLRGRQVFRSAALVVLGVFFLGVAAASAAEEPRYELAPAPETLTIPASHPGDRAVYAVRVLEGNAGGVRILQNNQTLELLRRADELVRDREGRERVVDVLELTEFAQDGQGTRLSTRVELRRDAASGEVVSHLSSFDLRGTESGSGLFDPVLERSVVFTTDAWEETRFTHVFPFCGESLPPGTWQLDESHELFAGCRLSTNRMQAQSFDALGVDASRGGAVVLRADSAPAETFLWILPGAPFPARILEVPTPGILFHEWELLTWERGPEPRQLKQEAGVPVPPIRFSTRLPWGPDDTAVSNPFPLSEAFRFAVEDPNSSRVRDFLAKHPDAFMQSAINHGDFTYNDGARAWQWDFVFSNGVELLDVWVMKYENWTQFEPDYPFASWPLAPAGRLQVDPTDVEGVTPVPPDLVPDNVPAVRSLLDWWVAYRGPDFRPDDPNHWGFEYRCTTDTCTDVQATFFGGRREFHHNYNGHPYLLPTFQQQTVSNASRLVIDSSGRAEALVERHEEATDFYEEPVPLGRQANAPTAASALAPQPIPDSWLPRAPLAAGLGVAALLAGVLYFLWSSVKQGLLLPAYTRLVRPAALAHPLRAKIVALVEAQPGIHFRAILRSLGRGPGQILHHLRTLQRFGLVRSHTARGYTCYFPSRWSADLIPALAALKSHGARQILAAILDQAGLSSKVLAQRIGFSPPTVTYHVQRLVAAHLVIVTRRHGMSSLEPTKLAQPALNVVG